MHDSAEIFIKAQKFIPGGVNSPVRAFNGVGGTPVFFKRGKGSCIIAEDNRKYIDYVCSWGPLILGHCNPAVLNSVQHTLKNGLSFGAPTTLEVTLAEMICDAVPGIDMVRMVNSGTEATMTAIRLARAYTRRDKILKFEGCYHGHADPLLVKAGSGALTLGVPSSPGIPADCSKHTLTASFNNLAEVETVFQKYGADIAAIITEPVPCNMGCVLPATGFLEGLRRLCNAYGSLLIFDEVITGFRLGQGGAQAHYHITPDLTTLGKIIGGGMPVGAFGGARDIMKQMAPVGPVYQAGTLSGNPVAMAAGIATLKELQKNGVYEDLADKTHLLTEGLKKRAHTAGIPLQINQIGSLFSLFFTELTKVDNFAAVLQSNVERFKKFYHAMLAQGIYLAPSAYETGFMSTAHGHVEIEATLDAAEKVFNGL